MTTTYLPLQPAVVLAHALVAHVADEVGIRVLFLKGPIATMQGLRAPDYVSGDVDALCEMGQEQRLIDALEARGWFQRAESEAHALFVTHSVTLCHPQWPCDIDVHTSFPGFLAPPRLVFDVLWAHRQTFDMAEVDVQGPDYPTQCLIVLLHGLRAPFLPKNQSEIAQSRDRFERMTEADIGRVKRLVEQTGAAEVVHQFFAQLGLSIPVPRRPTAEYTNWRLLTQPSNTEGWLVTLARTKGWQRWRILFRAVLPTREHLIIDHPAAALSMRATARAYIDRLTRAARLAPSAIHNVMLAGKARSHVEAPGVAVAMQAEAGNGPLQMNDEAVMTRSNSFDDSSTRDAQTAEADVRGSAGRQIAVYASPDDADVAYVLALPCGAGESDAGNVPVRVNLIGLELLDLLVGADGDVERVVREASILFERPTHELRPTIEDFRHEMLRLGVL